MNEWQVFFRLMVYCVREYGLFILLVGILVTIVYWVIDYEITSRRR